MQENFKNLIYPNNQFLPIRYMLKVPPYFDHHHVQLPDNDNVCWYL